MESKYWEKLELPAILSRLSEHTTFSKGKELALSLTPSTDLEEVRSLQEETAEGQRLLDVKPDFTLGGAHDLVPLIENAVRGMRLLPQDLLNIRDTLRRAKVVKRSVLRLEEQFPHIAGMARQLETCPELVNEIERCISEQGDVLDRASPALSRIRSALKVAHDRLMEKLNRIVSNPQLGSHLQEAYITQRDGRYVVPVRSDARSHIPGVVHDQSASGATLFVEPLATLELNNQWRELQLDEEREVERILLVLSGLVAEAEGEMRRTVDTLAGMDLVLAKAKYAHTIRATMPEMVPFTRQHSRGKGDRHQIPHPGSVIDLRRARHPLLDPQAVVAIDVHLGQDYFIIVITGPNTGGKTVSLKTVGLLALMAQCGLHLPVAEGSRLSVFEDICADIGDEQSIEQSLSTFSSHMSHIIHILERVDDRSLVLLDELGAGTDPLEGAALAQSLLIHLRQRRVTTLATTHYPQLKVFAAETPGVVNASVEFDLETLSPTYQLTIGMAGHSNAFAIANRLGLSETITTRAEGMVSSSHLEAERYLAQIKETQAHTVQAQEEVERAREEAHKLQAELRARLAGIEQEREQVLGRAREQASEELSAVRRELHSLQRKLAILSTNPSQVPEIEAQLEALERTLKPVEPTLVEFCEMEGPPVEVGDTVWVPDLNTTGEVLAVDGQAAEVQVGAFRVRTRRGALELRHKAAAQTVDPVAEQVSAPPPPDVSVELHLRGMRVEEALSRMEKYLDDAYRAQAPFVRIIHGKGSGTLRKAVREYLQGHPLVSSFRDGAEGEGDTGVTIVKFTGSS